MTVFSVGAGSSHVAKTEIGKYGIDRDRQQQKAVLTGSCRWQLRTYRTSSLHRHKRFAMILPISMPPRSSRWFWLNHRFVTGVSLNGSGLNFDPRGVYPLNILAASVLDCSYSAQIPHAHLILRYVRLDRVPIHVMIVAQFSALRPASLPNALH